MKTYAKINSVEWYLNNYLEQFIQQKFEIKSIENDTVILSINNKKKTLIFNTKVSKSYNTNDLVEMHFGFFKSLKSVLKYSIEKNETHVYCDDSISKNTKSNINNYLCSHEIYNFIHKLIEKNLGEDFELEFFLIKNYQYLVHFNNGDYLLELSYEEA